MGGGPGGDTERSAGDARPGPGEPIGDAVIARVGAMSENRLSFTLGLVFAGGTYGITNGSPTYPRPLAPDRELYGLSPRRKFGISSICGFELELVLLPDELDEL